MKKTILFFNSTSCGPCRLAKSQLTEEFIKELDVDIVSVKAESDFDTFTKYKVASVPTFVLVENDHELARKIGFKSKSDIVTLLG